MNDRLPGNTYYMDNLVGDDFKRARTMGFQGVRGKKNENLFPIHSDPDYPILQYDEKRARATFQGVRGKKASSSSSSHEDEDDFFNKRAPMGFQGMRGKKTIEEVIILTVRDNLSIIQFIIR